MTLSSLLLVPCALLIVGCGDSSSSSSSTTSSASDAGLRVSVTPARTAPGGRVEAVVVNGTEEQFTYGAGYELERQEGNDFQPVKLPRQPVIAIGYVAPPGETGPPIRVEIPKDALPGQYRVVIQRDVSDVGDLSGELEVSDD